MGEFSRMFVGDQGFFQFCNFTDSGGTAFISVNGIPGKQDFTQEQCPTVAMQASRCKDLSEFSKRVLPVSPINTKSAIPIPTTISNNPTLSSTARSSAYTTATESATQITRTVALLGTASTPAATSTNGVEGLTAQSWLFVAATFITLLQL